MKMPQARMFDTTAYRGTIMLGLRPYSWAELGAFPAIIVVFLVAGR
jgi:hypothetical protein